MADNSNKRQADLQFRKAQQAIDGKKAMSEYEANAAAVRAKTEKLRALRLAHEAELKAAAPPVAPVAKKAGTKGGKKAKGPTGTLADWLKTQQDGGYNN